MVLALAIATLAWSCSRRLTDYSQTVNSRLGDVSFINQFGHPPDASTDENLRIRTHLEYVENLLRQNDHGSLTNELRQRRRESLDLLHQYWTANFFPRNFDDRGERKPCFIDREGRICAVGYLIERSVGRAVAEKVNGKHKYERILAMNDETVDGWIASSGLSKEECAAIQPEYGYQNPPYNYNHITSEDGISSSLLGATNLSLSTLNIIQMTQKSTTKAVPIIGLVTGAGQAILGVMMIPEETRGFYGYTTNESQKVLAMVDIGLGVTTMILSTWTLLKTPEPNEKSVGWSLYGFPTREGDVGLGFSLTRRF